MRKARKTDFEWTDDRVLTFAQMVLDEKSSTQIAEYFSEESGLLVTKSTIVGSTKRERLLEKLRALLPTKADFILTKFRQERGKKSWNRRRENGTAYGGPEAVRVRRPPAKAPEPVRERFRYLCTWVVSDPIAAGGTRKCGKRSRLPQCDEHLPLHRKQQVAMIMAKRQAVP